MTAAFKTLNTLILCALTVLAISVGLMLGIAVMLGFLIADTVADRVAALRRRLAR